MAGSKLLVKFFFVGHNISPTDLISGIFEMSTNYVAYFFSHNIFVSESLQIVMKSVSL